MKFIKKFATDNGNVLKVNIDFTNEGSIKLLLTIDNYILHECLITDRGMDWKVVEELDMVESQKPRGNEVSDDYMQAILNNHKKLLTEVQAEIYRLDKYRALLVSKLISFPEPIIT